MLFYNSSPESLSPYDQTSGTWPSFSTTFVYKEEAESKQAYARSRLIRESLRHRGDNERGDAVLFGAHRDFGGHAALGAEGHAHIGDDFAAVHSLAEKLEGMCCLVDRYVGAFEGLEGENLCELFGGLCYMLLVFCK